MKTYSFEKLTVWHDAKELTLSMYAVTQEFPGEEKFGLMSQLRRASVSIASNIAEDSSRNSSRDQQRFYNIDYSTSIEVIKLLIICRNLEYITSKTYHEFIRLFACYRKLVYGFRCLHASYISGRFKRINLL